MMIECPSKKLPLVRVWADGSPLEERVFGPIPPQQSGPRRPTSQDRRRPVSASARMSLARIHDKYKVKTFWEQKIESHSVMIGSEESRMKSSALSKLREEWAKRLKFRNQHQESFYNERIRRAKHVQQVLKL